MAVLPILQYPDPRLKIKASPVQAFDAEVKQNIADLFETMYATDNCAGLAATQVNIQKRIIAIDLSPKKNEPLCLINPEILHQSGETNTEEGCMSVPGGIYEKVKRAETVKIKALDRDGKPFELETGDFLAKCIQHEIDHIDGILFIDHLSKLKRTRVDKKITKWHKLQEV